MTESDIYSWELTKFNLSGDLHIGGLGIQRIRLAEDGTLTLIGDANHGLIDQTKPTAVSFSRADSILGFVLDIGIHRERQLTFGTGFYFGDLRPRPQSWREVSQRDFDAGLFKQLGATIDSAFQSHDQHLMAAGIRLQHLLDTYNRARLLFPHFFEEGYLNFMRIVDALSPPNGYARGFAIYFASVSPAFNSDLLEKVKGVSTFAPRLTLAADIFSAQLTKASKAAEKSQMEAFSEADRFVFACAFSAYQYRNHAIHAGFPFPDIIREAVHSELDLATAYIHPSLASGWIRTHRPGGLKDGDIIDIHAALGNSNDLADKHYQLLPTWYFMRRIAREAILGELQRLAALVG